MNLLYRYILREHIGPFLFAFFVILFVLVVDLILQWMDRLISKGISFLTILEFFVLSLPWMIALAVPMAVLVATLMAFGRFSADHEITAMKAAGLSLYRLILPVLLAAIVISGGLVLFNNHVLPEANHRVHNLMTAVHRKKPTLSLKDREGTFIEDFPNLRILIEQIGEKKVRRFNPFSPPRPSSEDTESDSNIHGITLYQTDQTGLVAVVRAQSGAIRLSSDGDHLTLTLNNGEIHRIDENTPDHYVRQRFTKHLIYIADIGQRLKRGNLSQRGDREMSTAMMQEQIKKNRAKIEQHQANINAIVREFAHRYLPDFAQGTYRLPQSVRTDSARALHLNVLADQRRTLQKIIAEQYSIRIQERSINKYAVEIHKKYSIPVACIVFVLIGAPLGIMARRGGLGVGFGLSIGFFVIYWAFLIGGEALADRQLVSPALAMWSANLLIGAVGIYLTIHMVRETTFIRWERIRDLLPHRSHQPVIGEINR